MKKHSPDHWLLDKYEIEAIKLRQKVANSDNSGAFRQWYTRKKYSSDISEENEEINEADSELELDKEIYGDTAFISEYPLPKNELTYATNALILTE